MRQEPFSGSGPDGEEPDGPAPLPGAGNGSQDHPELASGPAGSGYDASASDGPPRDDDRDEAPPEEQLQGLYICLPAGQADLSGFTDGTATDPIAPGPLLAEVVTAVAGGDGAGLAEISEDCLFSVLSAARRMSSWGTWLELAAMHELAVRHPATQDRTSRQKRAAQDQPAPQDQPAVPKPADAAQDAAGAGAAGAPGQQPAADGRPSDGPEGPEPDGGPQDGPGGNGGNGPRPYSPAGTDPKSPDAGASRPARKDTGPCLAALINITVPLATALGHSGTPGEAAGFGILDAATARPGTARPRTTRLTITGPSRPRDGS
jgi:hypothetical protein